MGRSIISEKHIERNLKIIERYNNGEFQKVIAKDLGVTPECISSIIINTNKYIENRNKYLKRNKEIVKLYLNGLSQEDVGKRFKLKQAAVSYILSKHNVESQRKFKGEHNPNWKGGIMYDRNRKLIYSPNHPNNSGKYCYEYRLIMEKKLGRYLTKDEVVHHINGDHTDNREENLQVMTHKEHFKLHQEQGDMKQDYKSKYNFTYSNEKEYNKRYMEIYNEKHKERLIQYRKDKWKKHKNGNRDK